LAGDAAPHAAGWVVVDLDGVPVIAHSEKQDAAATWKKTFGHHPLMGFVDWLSARGRWLLFCVGMTTTDAIHPAVLKVPASSLTPAVEPDGEIREGAWVAELAGDCLKGWPKGMRLIVRKERARQQAQEAAELRRAMADRLIEDGYPDKGSAIEAAVRLVPRHQADP
jgi:hypothetical protein